MPRSRAQKRKVNSAEALSSGTKKPNTRSRSKLQSTVQDQDQLQDLTSQPVEDVKIEITEGQFGEQPEGPGSSGGDGTDLAPLPNTLRPADKTPPAQGEFPETVDRMITEYLVECYEDNLDKVPPTISGGIVDALISKYK